MVLIITRDGDRYSYTIKDGGGFIISQGSEDDIGTISSIYDKLLKQQKETQ